MLLLVGLTLSATLVDNGSARTQAVQPWSVNGPVDALLVSGHTLYVGGQFTQITPRTGPLLAVSSSTGTPLRAFPSLVGNGVYAITGDGKGGWFVGGDFRRIGGVACTNLAHVTAGMAVDPHFCPRPNASVFSLALDGSTLYAGGLFSLVAGTRRPYLAAIDAGNGRLTSWVPPAIDGGVDAFALRNGVIYLLGPFETVGGKHRFSLAAVDIRTRKVTGWNPKAPPYGGHGDPSVRSIAATATAIYVGGIFDTIGGKKQSGLAALNPTTGKATSFSTRGDPWSVEALTVAGGRLYAGGFTHSGGYLQAYAVATGKALSWTPPVDNSGVASLAVAGSRVYVGGARLQAFDAATGARLPWSPPAPNQRVFALAVSGRTVVAGGSFTGAGGAFRDGIAAIDLRTGQPTNWHPNVLSLSATTSVDAIAVSHSTVYLGGDFDRVGGKTRHLVAAVAAKTGAVMPWAPTIAGDQVLAIAASGRNVFIGGFDVGTAYDIAGRTIWNSPPTGTVASVNDIVAAGGTVYIGGTFSVIGGKSREGLAALDARNGSATAWNPRLRATDGDASVNAFAPAGRTMYVGGSFDFAGAAKRRSLAAFDRVTGKWTAWAPKPGIVTTYALAATASAVYVGGDGGAEAFDPRTGAQLDWHPVLASTQSNSLVHAIAVVGSTVYVGDDGGLEVFPAVR